MRFRVYKSIGKGAAVGTTVFVGGIFYSIFVIIGVLFVVGVIYYIFA